MSIVVWYLLIDHNRKPLGQFRKVPLEEDIFDLQEMVKQENAAFLNHVASPQLVVLRRTDPAIPIDGRRESLQGYIDEFFSGAFDELGSMMDIADLNISNKEKLLVQLLGAFLTMPNEDLSH